jgi:drug/metabolite transporter (DMT)-like permease
MEDDPMSRGTAAAVGGEIGARQLALGAAFGTAAALIWAGWMVVTRVGVSGALGPFDLAALRFGIAGLVLVPVLARHRGAIGRVPPLLLLAMVVGAGAPFAVIGASGLRFASAGSAGALIPGVLPLFVALLSMALLKERIGAGRRLGLGLILAGIVAIAALRATHETGANPGHLLFLCASLLWAGFTLALRRSGLTAIQAVALVAIGSCLVYLPLYLLLLEPGLARAPLADLAFQGLYQGLLSGIVAIWCFGRAVALLGPARGAVFAALVPALATLMGMLLLGEMPALEEGLGVLLVSAGVCAAAGLRLPLPATSVRRRAPIAPAS